MSTWGQMKTKEQQEYNCVTIDGHAEAKAKGSSILRLGKHTLHRADTDGFEQNTIFTTPSHQRIRN